MKDDCFKELVLVVVVFLVVSLMINAFLTSDPQSLSGPPLRITGYFTALGEPIPGYYLAPDQISRENPAGENNRINK
jgi:hypothetical protein